MSRILFAFTAVAPSAAVAHVGSHPFDATDTLVHSVSFADHALALIGVLTLPVAVVGLIRRRLK